jgi:hypothetical protein
MIRFVKRLVARSVLGLRSGHAHAAWGYSLRETVAHLRRPRPWQIVFGILGHATPTGCLACPTIKQLQEAR